MANHVSSTKRARASEQKKQRNSKYLSAVRTSVKKFRFALNGIASGASADLESVGALLTSAQSMLAKAASKGFVHRNNAARRISRLALALKRAATAATTTPDTKTPVKKTAKTGAKKTGTGAKKASTKSKK